MSTYLAPSSEAGPSSRPMQPQLGVKRDVATALVDTPVKTTAACAACRQRKIKCPGEKPTCANCEKTKCGCVYPPMASRKRRHRDRTDSVWSAGNPTSEIERQNTANLPMWTNSPAQQTFYNPPGIMTVQNLTGEFHTGASTPSVWGPLGQLYQPLDPGTLSTGGYNNLDSLLALDPAYPSIPSDSSPVVPGFPGSAGGLSQNGGIAQSPAHVKFRVPYFRFFGPTAIAPGYKQVTSNVSRACSPTIRDLSGLMGQPRFSPAPYDEYPYLDTVNQLVPVFQAHYGYLFASIQIPRIESLEGLTSITPSLLNIICALAARFSPLYGGQTPKQGMGSDADTESGWEQVSSVWATKAKEQCGRSLAVPTTGLVETLLLISWYEFGGDRDSGLWMYSGMAMRMSQDLGLDGVGKSTYQGDPTAERERRLNCCLRIMDGVMTIGSESISGKEKTSLTAAGRLGMFQDSGWTSPSFPPLRRADGGDLPDPMEHLLRIFGFAKAITGILLQKRLHEHRDELIEIQRQLSEFYGKLPSELRFQASTLQAYAALYQGEAFVLLHVWFHALIILSYRPDLLLGEASADRPGDNASVEVAASSAKSISDIISFAELIDAKAVCQPWINYPLYLAARTFLSKCDEPLNSANLSGAKAHIARAARQDFQRVMSMMRMVGQYWRGVRYILRALQQKAEGIQQVELADEWETLSPEIMALLERAATRPTGDAVGLSLVGTVKSPSDNQYGLVFPPPPWDHQRDIQQPPPSGTHMTL